MRIHSSISRLTPFWLSHFYPGSEGLFEFLALWRISKLSPGCRTRQDAEVAVLPFFTQWHMWPGPPFPAAAPLRDVGGVQMLHLSCACGGHVRSFVCTNACWGGSTSTPGNSCLTLLISAQLYTPFPGLTPTLPSNKAGPEGGPARDAASLGE